LGYTLAASISGVIAGGFVGTLLAADGETEEGAKTFLITFSLATGAGLLYDGAAAIFCPRKIVSSSKKVLEEQCQEINREPISKNVIASYDIEEKVFVESEDLGISKKVLLKGSSLIPIAREIITESSIKKKIEEAAKRYGLVLRCNPKQVYDAIPTVPVEVRIKGKDGEEKLKLTRKVTDNDVIFSIIKEKCKLF
jgi:hypothetical protein